MSAICPNCGIIERTVAQQIGGKITFGLAAAALSARAVRNPLIAVVCVIAGLMVGHYIDQGVSRYCPQCGTILRIASLLP